MAVRVRDNPLRPRHAWLYALADGRLPENVRCAGRTFTLVETFKHDFFAATGLYRSGDCLAVLKLGRRNHLLSIPVDWIGRLLTRREVAAYEKLQDLPGIPRLIGTVGRHGFMHAFVPGHPLSRSDAVSDTFFDELAELLAAVHGRHVAYVDLNKPQNVLIGDDGRPYLIDFQISLDLPPTGWRELPPVRWLLGRFQHADRYHFLKHKRKLRPDQLTETERREVGRLSIWIRIHRVVTRPITNLRRRTLKRLARSESGTVAGSSAK